MTNQRIDGYLSRLCQRLWPTALVLVRISDGVEEWIIQRDRMDDLGLGDNFNLANQSVRALIKSEDARHEK